MEQCHSWEADSCSPSHEITRILCNRKVHYRAHNSRQLVPVLCQMNPVLISTSHCFTIHFNIISPSMSRSRKRSLPLTVLHQNPVCILYTPHPPHTPWINYPVKICWEVRIMKILVMQFSPVSNHYLLGTHFSQFFFHMRFFPSGPEAILKAKVSIKVNGFGQLAWFLN